jgi:hypothetical protein
MMFHLAVLRKNLALVRSLTGPRDKTARLTLYIHRCLTGAVVIVEFEFVVEMNLVQIGTNEFFPYGQKVVRRAELFKGHPHGFSFRHVLD